MARNLSATERLRRNMMRQISRMEESGYRIDTELKETLKTAKYQTLNKYAKLRYKNLYEEATALSEEGDIVSGIDYRQEVYSRRARKAAETRKLSKPESIDNKWEKERRLKDIREQKYARIINEGEMIYDNIIDLINMYPIDASDSLKKGLESEIRRYGKNAVLFSLTDLPEDVIEGLQNIVHYSGTKEQIHRAYKDFFDAIKGSIPSDEEAKEMGEVMDRMTDMDTY